MEIHRVPISSLLTSDENMIQRFSENGREYYRYGNDMYLFPCDDVGYMPPANLNVLDIRI
jgi:hypothetical protein